MTQALTAAPRTAESPKARPRTPPTTTLRLSPRQRKLVLTVHVIASVGWIGLDLVLLTLGVAGLTSDDPELLRGAYLVARLLGTTLIPVVSLAALASGVLLGLGTKWGLARYWWVLVKLVITVGMTAASNILLRMRLDEAADRVSGVPAATLTGDYVGPVATGIASACCFALALLVTTSVLSVYKPWGRILRGRRSPNPSGSLA
jgi:hypothetical protein